MYVYVHVFEFRFAVVLVVCGMRSCQESGLTTTKPSQQSPTFMAPHPGPALVPLPQRLLMEQRPPHLLAWTQPKWLKVRVDNEEEEEYLYGN